MWKDKLRIGVDIIDEQHKKLFDRIGSLLKQLNESGVKHRQECIDAIVFLKEYAVEHFANEEAYQQSIGYKGFAAHKKLHEGFIKTVLEHEQKMLASDFAEKDVKEFTGMLVAWLLYHVANSDQKIGKEAKPVEILHSHSDIVCYSIFDVLNKMAGLDTALMKRVESHSETFDETVVVEVGFTGDISGYIDLCYPDFFIKNLMHSMMGFTPEIIGELEISALFEMSNIISGTICRQITKDGDIFCDITPPQITHRSDVSPDERLALDTGQGIYQPVRS